MTFLADLVGDLSWSLKAAWIIWAAWIAIQIVWLRRVRAAGGDEPIVQIGDRFALGLNAGLDSPRMSSTPVARPGRTAPVVAEVEPEPELTLPLTPAAMEAVEGTILTGDAPAPVPAPKRQRRRRQSARQEAAAPA